MVEVDRQGAIESTLSLWATFTPKVTLTSERLVQSRDLGVVLRDFHGLEDGLARHQNSTTLIGVCCDEGMTEKKNAIPKPSIRNTPPEKPPVTSSDTAEPKAPEVKKEEAPPLVPTSTTNEVETDLVKRFLGAFIDGLIALTVAVIVGAVTGSALFQYLAWGMVILLKDSLPVLEGQSIGKKVMKTKAVKADGSSLSGDWITGATRNLLLAIPLVGLAECFVILTRSGNPAAGLRIGDEWAKTKVISVE
jgi:uncharacterized RDD family membrane protein YckC